MSNLYGHTTKLFSTPYLTTEEYKQAPTSIDYSNLVLASSDPAVQDAELANVIARASSWIDVHCNQVLSATEETEQQRSRLRPDGMLAVHPRYFPIVALTSLSYGITPNQMIDFPDLSFGWIEDQSFVIPYTASNLTYSSQGPIQFGMPAIPRSQVFTKYTYISGYANTTLAANANAGATSITVVDGSGITAGARMTIYDGMNSENIVVASNYTFGSTTVPLESPLAYAQTSGVSVSALPPAIKQAAILVTTAFIKVRGDNSLTMDVVNTPHQNSITNKSITSDLDLAKELLVNFRRVR